MTVRERLKKLIRRLTLRRRPQADPPPADPYADRLAPVRKGPKGRSGAAVAEPEEDSNLNAYARR